MPASSTIQPTPRRRVARARPRMAARVCLGCAISLGPPGAEATAQARNGVEPDAGRPSATAPTAAAQVAPFVDWVLGAVFLGSLASVHVDGLDRLDEVLRPSPGRRDALDRWIPRTLGRFEVGFGLVGATYLVGLSSGSEVVSRVGLRSLETLLFNTAVTNVFKLGLGRARPDSGLEEDDFRPFTTASTRRSFPSGHTSNAFALATTVSRELGESAPWVPFVAYPIASWVGISRVLDERHWLTDVVAGAALGVLSSRLGERLLRPRPRSERGQPPRATLLLTAGEPFFFGVSLPAP